MLLSSAQNPKIKFALHLQKRRERDLSGLFLIEGYRELLRACGANIFPTILFFCPEFFLGSNEQALLDLCESHGTELYQCTQSLFTRLSYRDRPDGLVGIAAQKRQGLKEMQLPKTHQPFYVVAEAIEKPGNLGTILRSSDAVGVDGVIVCDRCTDLYNPNVVRASVGTLFTVPLFEAEGEELRHYLRSAGISIVAATPHADQEYTDTDFSGPVAIIVGTEQYGLSEPWLNMADKQVRIPMQGIADSLNVATATTLLLYEVLRQRRSLSR